MKEIARIYDLGEAQVVVGYLRSRGFDVEIADYHTLSARPELAIGLGGFRIMAANQDAFMATKALEEKRPKPRFAPCPRCKSTKVRRRRAWGFPLAVTALFASLFPFAPATDSLRCATCGHSWKDEE
ncbi:putative signal transducing protein [Parvularcula lutaonensis]|uniref:Signal transducing protein n=1 Tax=Parvularcula lutaonensis TaxID=491923 RepID=A0ABV7MD51_9PROT|nr:DUF2007 domain-containing protein [Parvularcula lutaonensis]GGY52333.1 hypothetical protein GCM10007148_21780 [Parvularcula lutaonensis]